MNKSEVVPGIIVSAIGGAMLIGSRKLAYLQEGVPGPAFLPVWLSICLIIFGIILFIKGIRPGPVQLAEVPWPERTGWRRNGLMIGALAVSFLLFEWLGFVVTTTLFMAVVAFGLGVRSWGMLLSLPLLSAGLLYGIFAVLLRVPLPKGILPF
jgi:putative tricarboxylic transport membrane protein